MKLSHKILMSCVIIMPFVSGCASGDRTFPQGLKDGRLADCPASPNCVSTQASDSSKRMPTLPFIGDVASSKQKIVVIVQSLKRSKLIEDQDHYLHIEFRSAVFRFVDDVEFFFDVPEKRIHFRSASRTGYSDLGVNRKRMESIVQLYMKENG